jgi:hypothetical protein
MHLTDHISDVQLNEYLDNEAADQAQIKLHLDSCGECAARLSALQDLFAELESLPELELSRDLAASFTSPRSLPAQIPAWFPLTVTLQAAVALTAIVLAAPFVIQLLPVFEMPSLSDALMQIQSQWTTWLDMLSQFQMPSLPVLSFESSSLYLMSALGAASMLWLVGNGLLLRNQIK